MNDSEKLAIALDGIVRDVDQGCINTSLNCFTCKRNSKCQVMFIKEALCKIQTGCKSMSSDEYLKAREAYWRSQL